MGYTDGPCCGDKHNHGVLPARAAEGEIKESRGGSARRGRRAGDHVHKRRKEGGEGGVRYGERRCGAESRPDARKGKVHSAQGRRALHDIAVTRKRDDNGPDIDGVRRARSEMTQHVKHGQLKTGFGTRRPL